MLNNIELEQIRNIVREELELQDLRHELERQHKDYWRAFSRQIEMQEQFGYDAGEGQGFVMKSIQERIKDIEDKIKELEK